MIVDSTSEKERLIAKLYVDQSDPQFVNTECFEEKRQIYHCTELFELILERSMVRQLCIEGSLLTNDTSVWLIVFLRRTGISQPKKTPARFLLGAFRDY